MGKVPLLKAAVARAPEWRPTRGAGGAAAPPPLVVDLDGTLLRTDVTLESIFVLAKRHPLALFALPFTLLRGRAALKQFVARRAQPDVDTLPLDMPLLEFLREQKEQGRKLVLATGADELPARRIAGRLDLFDAVFASDGHANMTGHTKRDRLVAEFGLDGFDYAGNSRRDLPVWSAARRAIVAGGAVRHLDAVRRSAVVERVFDNAGEDSATRRLGTWLAQLRWRHWIKNALVLVPLLLSHRLAEPVAATRALLATVGFCAAASSIYLLNDLLDLPTDRRHPRKRDRPLASGRLPILQVVAAIPLLWCVALLACLPLPHSCLAILALYVVVMLVYSLRIKDLRYLDAVVLGGGYTLRLLAGTWAIGQAINPWLAAWCLPTFFGLALLKRRAELATSATHPDAAHARAYRAGDAHALQVLGGAAACVGLAALALMPVALNDGPLATGGLWLACLLIALWSTRMWRCAATGQIDDDPVSFALHDRRGRWMGAGASVLLAILA
jgi:4-hydroxybenzoate polyprenyltransferase